MNDFFPISIHVDVYSGTFCRIGQEKHFVLFLLSVGNKICSARQIVFVWNKQSIRVVTNNNIIYHSHSWFWLSSLSYLSIVISLTQAGFSNFKKTQKENNYAVFCLHDHDHDHDHDNDPDHHDNWNKLFLCLRPIKLLSQLDRPFAQLTCHPIIIIILIMIMIIIMITTIKLDANFNLKPLQFYSQLEDQTNCSNSALIWFYLLLLTETNRLGTEVQNPPLVFPNWGQSAISIYYECKRTVLLQEAW